MLMASDITLPLLSFFSSPVFIDILVSDLEHASSLPGMYLRHSKKSANIEQLHHTHPRISRVT